MFTFLLTAASNQELAEKSRKGRHFMLNYQKERVKILNFVGKNDNSPNVYGVSIRQYVADSGSRKSLYLCGRHLPCRCVYDAI